ncbi:hypothetical protein FN846DRAFT_993615 [Sphaerosporella brunnea]|uniref:Uncharacterized protein n=1 Tax=Sphaerosporella brunnea TaxID=1250544 RepID=A0A5J5EN09_9PEZI|nr:hypothetical protein FN846DRAFT_993615 [Sphaerosporella brunnea]
MATITIVSPREKDTLKMKVQRALRRVLDTSGVGSADAKLVTANLQDPLGWQHHQPAIGQAFGANAELAAITIRFVLRSLGELDEILDVRYPLPQAHPHVHLDFGPPPSRPRAGLAYFFRTRYIQFRGSRKVNQCDRMLGEVSRVVGNLYSIVVEQQRQNREVIRDRRARVV